MASASRPGWSPVDLDPLQREAGAGRRPSPTARPASCGRRKAKHRGDDDRRTISAPNGQLPSLRSRARREAGGLEQARRLRLGAC